MSNKIETRLDWYLSLEREEPLLICAVGKEDEYAPTVTFEWMSLHDSNMHPEKRILCGITKRTNTFPQRVPRLTFHMNFLRFGPDRYGSNKTQEMRSHGTCSWTEREMSTP